MTENQDPTPTEDVEGHMPFRKFTDDQPQGDDAEGHVLRGRGFTDDEPDDTEGHGRVRVTDEDDDTEGHAVTGGFRPTHPKVEDADDDVAGHLSGALGSRKKSEDGS